MAKPILAFERGELEVLSPKRGRCRRAPLRRLLQWRALAHLRPGGHRRPRPSKDTFMACQQESWWISHALGMRQRDEGLAAVRPGGQR